MLAQDKLQIYVDTDELIVRPASLGTDAIERNRTAESYPMLDADFEYGLHPLSGVLLQQCVGIPFMKYPQKQV